MNDNLPPLPKGYMLAERRSEYFGIGGALIARTGSREWRPWGALYHHDWHVGRFFAVPKSRYTCPLEFSRYV